MGGARKPEDPPEPLAAARWAVPGGGWQAVHVCGCAVQWARLCRSGLEARVVLVRCDDEEA